MCRLCRDIRLSHDLVPVLIHDARLDRTTSGTGQANDLTVKELKELDAGDGGRIPALVEVLPVAAHLDRGLFIEIKEPGSEEIVSRITGNSYTPKLIFISFHPDSLSIMESCLPGVKTGIILPDNQEHHQIDENWFRFDLLLPRLNFMSPELTDQAHDSGTLVIPWILTTRGELEKAINLGVDGVITDDPCNIARLLPVIME